MWVFSTADRDLTPSDASTTLVGNISTVNTSKCMKTKRSFYFRPIWYGKKKPTRCFPTPPFSLSVPPLRHTWKNCGRKPALCVILSPGVIRYAVRDGSDHCHHAGCLWIISMRRTQLLLSCRLSLDNQYATYPVTTIMQVAFSSCLVSSHVWRLLV